MSDHHPIVAQRPAIVDVGTPPSDNALDGWEKVEVHFHGFEDLPYTQGDGITSPEFHCFGRQWKLELYPGGDDDSDPGNAAIYLLHCSKGRTIVEYNIVVRDRYDEDSKLHMTWGTTTTQVSVWGDCDFAHRAKLLEAVSVNGTLVVEVGMKLRGDAVRPFIPENPLCKNILKTYNDEETADVLFEVGGGSNHSRNSRKRANAAPVAFYAHRLILQNSNSTLAEMSRSAKQMSPIQIADVKPEIFDHMLRYVYGGDVPEADLKANAEEIIDAADKYGVVNLKLAAEACYAKSVELTVDNVIDTLLYAESKNCALLKEVAIDYIAANGTDVLEKVSFANVPGTMMKDLLVATTRGKKRYRDDNDYSTMRVSALRRKLHEKGYDVDGSREAMIALLKEHS